MWKIPKDLVQRQRRRRLNHEELFAAAATLTGGVMWVLGQKNRNEKRATDNDSDTPRAFADVDSVIKHNPLIMLRLLRTVCQQR